MGCWLSSVTYVLPIICILQVLYILVTLVGNGPRWRIFLGTYAIYIRPDTNT